MKSSRNPQTKPAAKVTNHFAVKSALVDVIVENQESDAARRLAAIIESSDDAIVGKDLNGIIQSWNTGAEKIFGYSAKNVIGKSITILIPPERRSEERDILDRIRRGQRVHHYETIRVHRDGTLLHVSLTISPIKDGSGKVIGASKIARDITDRKRAEAQQQALFDFTGVINRTTNLTEIYTTALEAVLVCQQAHRAAIQIHHDGGPMKIVASRNLSTAFRISMEGYSPWKTESNPKTILIADAPAGLDAKISPVIVKEGIRALAFIPIIFEHRIKGQIGIYYNIPHPFSRNEVRPAEMIAAQIAFAIERREFVASRLK